MTLPAARATEKDACPTHLLQLIIHPTSPDTEVAREGQARFADRMVCTDAVLSGASTVLVNGLPAARMTDNTAHGGLLITGEATVLIDKKTVQGKQMRNSNGELTNNFVAHDVENGRLFIVSYIQFSGPDTSEAFANAAKADIESMWSGSYRIRGKTTAVIVKVNTLADKDPRPGYDQVTVDKTIDRANQTLGGGPGQQDPETDTASSNNFTPAHEYGHTLGIKDQYMDVKGKGSVPDPTKTQNTSDNIMVQTWKDPATGNKPHPYPEHYEEMLSFNGM
jgi:uncharacterized Zn-binding protein involved in type VI secretion